MHSPLRSSLAWLWKGVCWLLRPSPWIIREGLLVRPQWDLALSLVLTAFCLMLAIYTATGFLFAGCEFSRNHPIKAIAAAFLGWRLFGLLIQRVYFPDWRERRESNETLDCAWKN